MDTNFIILLCRRLYSILDNERLEELIRHEAATNSARRGIYLIYQSFRTRTKNWVDLDYDRATLTITKRNVLDCYPVSQTLATGLSDILTDINDSNNNDFFQTVVDAISAKGLFAEALSAAYMELLDQLCKT